MGDEYLIRLARVARVDSLVGRSASHAASVTHPRAKSAGVPRRARM